MPMYYLNANLISLYIQPGLTVMAAVQILSFRSVRPLLAPRGKMDYFDQRLASFLHRALSLWQESCFRYGPAWKGILLLLMHYLLFIAYFMLILLCIKIKYPFFIIVFVSTVPILYHYWLEKTWLLPKYANIYDPLWRAIHHMYIL
ncbi:hypothetical protein [Lactobacillus delbrueckii]|uniref:hypothetical protein n=1 Tax=Lactobacillus delbrueckii TaxID=1584 RepID=UPI00272CDB7F|nr:hypothetical protein [Lactobacillus delbrueckii]WKZ98724.1 hypothetical protein MJT43_02005 [Lactobacillus delbrueckii]